jgi:hypothetical protein
MRRLLAFLAVALALLAAEAGFNWWIDPFGTFWKPGALTAAERGGCLVSQELVGNAYPQFKLDVFRHRPTHTFVIGSSRTVKIAARPGEETFSNLGIPNITPAVLLHVLRAIPAGAPRQTMYVGVEGFWFNPAFAGGPATGWYPEAKYLLSAHTFVESAKFVRRAPWELRRRWRTVQVGGRCVIGRTDPGLTWRLDGSRLYGFELQPGLYRPATVPFATDLSSLDFGYYGGWAALDPARLRTFDEALALAERRHWRVVGFTLPNPTRVARFLRTSREWRRFEQSMPALFARHGFRFLDLTDVRTVPCPQDGFADGTFHPDAACSDAIRARLDRAAR